MCDILDDIKNESTIEQVRMKVREICERLPVYRAD